MKLRFAFALITGLASGCTLHHSKQALLTAPQTPSDKARFVTEEDSGLALFGLFQLSEPDHYAVLLERARRRNRCGSLHDAQLDFYTDYWIVLSFPISRVTLLCEPEAPASVPQAPAPPPPAPAAPSASVRAE